MPRDTRNTRHSRESTQNEAKSVGKAVVANVNKQLSKNVQSSMSPRGKTQSKRKLDRQQTGSELIPEKYGRLERASKADARTPIKANKQARSRPQAGTPGQGHCDEPEGDRSQSNLILVNEESEQVAMAVQGEQPNKDPFPSRDDTSDDEQLDYYDDLDQEDNESTDSVKILHLTEEERMQRIKALDQEMSDKMVQLHQLMYDGGLTKTARYMQDNFHVTDTGVAALNSPARGVTRRETSKPRPRTPSAGIVWAEEQHGYNKNCNHNPDFSLAELSKSVETIYRNAVEKLVSSSSDECVDISDETLGLIPDPEDEYVEDHRQLVVNEPQPSTSEGR